MKASQKKLIKMLLEVSSALSQIEGQEANVEELNKSCKEFFAKMAIDKEANLEGCVNTELLQNCLSQDLDLEGLSVESDFSGIGKELVSKAKNDKDTAILFSNQRSNTTPSIPKTRNPFSKAHFNLTEQARLTKVNPELAARLKSEADNE